MVPHDPACDPELLIVGEFAEGAYGPTIMIKLLSPRAARWMMDALRHLAATPGAVLELAGRPEVRLGNLRSMMLRHGRSSTAATLRRITASGSPLRFEWELDAEGWTSVAELLEPFVAGRPGHQYLSREGIDDALVIVSFSEPEVRISPQDGRE